MQLDIQFGEDSNCAKYFTYYKILTSLWCSYYYYFHLQLEKLKTWEFTMQVKKSAQLQVLFTASMLWRVSFVCYCLRNIGSIQDPKAEVEDQHFIPFTRNPRQLARLDPFSPWGRYVLLSVCKPQRRLILLRKLYWETELLPFHMASWGQILSIYTQKRQSVEELLPKLYR